MGFMRADMIHTIKDFITLAGLMVLYIVILELVDPGVDL